MERYAHSPRKKREIAAQTYREHAVCVTRAARGNAARAARYYNGDRAEFRRAVGSAAAWHDLGKLDDGKQAVLCCKERGSLPFPPHEESGIAHLLRQEDHVAAALVAAHHRGLFDGEEYSKRRFGTRGSPLFGSEEEEVRRWLADHLEEMASRHGLTRSPTGKQKKAMQLLTPFAMRIGLSCLVDADHGDTARNYRQEPQVRRVEAKWNERVDRLRAFAEAKPKKTERDRRRQRFFDACAEATVEPSLRTCAAPVGSGKTLAVMAHLLRAAQEKGLRHIFVVLPYTNIVRQSVKEYRDALTLDGEDPESVVAELHHLADFENPDLRHLAALWRAPIIVTTAVAFFETMASHRPAALRKFHELPGSAVFLDEAHAALPEALWPVTWGWIREWTEHWGGHMVLGSGSLFRFWEAEDFLPMKGWRPEAPDLVPPKMNEELQTAEKARLLPTREDTPFDAESLCARLLVAPTPRLAILNTIRSTATIARMLADKCKDRPLMPLRERRVLHLSTALAPIHRDPVVEEVKRRLCEEPDRDWTLVATSCVEAGLDFSFRCAFREASTVASLIQTGGRVRRNEESWAGELVSFRIGGEGITPHKAFSSSATDVDRMVSAGDFGRFTPSELLKRAFARSLIGSFEKTRDELLRLEKGYEFPKVTKAYRVIEDETTLAVVDPDVVARVVAYERVPFSEIVRASVRVRLTARDVGSVSPVPGREELMAWTGEYDSLFLGFMASRQIVDQIYRDGGAYA